MKFWEHPARFLSFPSSYSLSPPALLFSSTSSTIEEDGRRGRSPGRPWCCPCAIWKSGRGRPILRWHGCSQNTSVSHLKAVQVLRSTLFLASTVRLGASARPRSRVLLVGHVGLQKVFLVLKIELTNELGSGGREREAAAGDSSLSSPPASAKHSLQRPTNS
jgi:hypothetical protein